MILRTAFATSDGIEVDRHFGASKRFDIYEINTESNIYKRIDIRTVENACLNHNHDDKRIEAVVETIADCNYVFAELSGTRARIELEKKNIQAVDVERPIKDILDNILFGKVKLIDKRYAEIEKKSLKSNFTKLQKKHPCMSGGANLTAGRIHLPVSPSCNIQCKFCTRQFDKSLISEIEKAIQIADLGFNPSNDGKVIRITIPALTADRRKELVKQAKTIAENSRTAIRNIRRDGNDDLKKQQKDGVLTEDGLKTETDKLQKLTDKYIEEINKIYDAKEKEILN